MVIEGIEEIEGVVVTITKTKIEEEEKKEGKVESRENRRGKWIKESGLKKG